jgi:hypothetical protein
MRYYVSLILTTLEKNSKLTTTKYHQITKEDSKRGSKKLQNRKHSMITLSIDRLNSPIKTVNGRIIGGKGRKQESNISCQQ